MENVTKEAEKAIKVLEKEKRDVDQPIWENIFQAPMPGLEITKTDLDSAIPLYEEVVIRRDNPHYNII